MILKTYFFIQSFTIKNRVNIVKNICQFFILFIIITIFLMLCPVIHLDADPTITCNIEGKNLTVSYNGDVWESILSTLGTAGVFSVGAKIGLSLASKNKLGVFPKTGSVILGGSGLAISYRMITKVLPSVNPLVNPNSLSLNGDFSVTLQIPSEKAKEIIESLIEPKLVNFITDKSGTFVANQDTVLTALDKSNPEWKSGFKAVEGTSNTSGTGIESVPINSGGANGPVISSVLEDIERTSALKSYVVDSLLDNLHLHYIMLYLFIVLILVLLSKWLLSSNTSFERVKEYPLGSLVYFIIQKYISIWSKLSNI